MKNRIKYLALILAISLCLGATSCAKPPSNEETTPGDQTTAKPEETTLAVTPEETTPEETTPEETPEATPEATPEQTTPETTAEPETEPEGKVSASVETPEVTAPIESTPEVTPEATAEATTPAETPESDLPVAENDLTAEQMAEIEEAFGGEIDWDKHYFGIHDGYVYFGTTDGSNEYYSTKNSGGSRVYFGYVNAVYTFKDGEIADAGETFVNGKTEYGLTFVIGRIAIRKTLDEFPSIKEDLAEGKIDGFSPYLYYYYGVYNGYVVYAEHGNVADGVLLRTSEARVYLMIVDKVGIYKDGETLAIYGHNTLIPDGIFTAEDLMRIVFIHNALVVEEMEW